MPFVVFRPGGDFTYLQLGVFGSLLARLIVGYVLVPAYYQREIYSPYDYMGNRLGQGVRKMTTGLFMLGGMLAQSSRVYLTAVVLEVILHGPLSGVSAALHVSPLTVSIWIIGIIAIVWTILGGITTVIWTDVIQVAILVGGAIEGPGALLEHTRHGLRQGQPVALDAARSLRKAQGVPELERAEGMRVAPPHGPVDLHHAVRNLRNPLRRIDHDVSQQPPQKLPGGFGTGGQHTQARGKVGNLSRLLG